MLTLVSHLNITAKYNDGEKVRTELVFGIVAVPVPQPGLPGQGPNIATIFNLFAIVDGEIRGIPPTAKLSLPLTSDQLAALAGATRH